MSIKPQAREMIADGKERYGLVTGITVCGPRELRLRFRIRWRLIWIMIRADLLPATQLLSCLIAALLCGPRLVQAQSGKRLASRQTKLVCFFT